MKIKTNDLTGKITPFNELSHTASCLKLKNYIMSYHQTNKKGRYDVDYSTIYDETKKVMTISFQGSISIIDWILNFFFIPIPTKPYKGSKIYFIHRGHIKRYKAVRDDIHNAIAKHPDIEVINVIGYSLGAAMATLGYDDMIYHYTTKEVYGLGGGVPRVLFIFGNIKGFVNRTSNFIRLIHGLDIVERLPFKILGFTDIGKRINFCVKKHKASWWPFRKNVIKDHIDFSCCEDALKSISKDVKIDDTKYDWILKRMRVI